ncbi:hypothetical protein [Halomonas sp. GD1P12]|uniref:hypothetical protein n=1 Tax=Halomonas sp. GD1P12 TaxID=2982691 RepID=UPI0021E4C252|nr:hypothetical protein [Halomonas sp. GD1P12]UYG01260.1 hypothetical protein OCT39_06825 [Halomonas sp. GD1P12]
MARKAKGGGVALLIALVVLAVLYELFISYWTIILLLAIVGIVAFVLCAAFIDPVEYSGSGNSNNHSGIEKKDKKPERLRVLEEKYKNEQLARKIYGGYFWQGQSESQLRDSLGQPEAIDTKVLKTKTKEVWKYYPIGRRSYGLRITLDDGKVVGWDKKT